MFLAFGLRRPEPIDITQAWLPADATWLLAFLIGFLGVYSDRKAALRLLRASLPLVIVVVLAAVSLLWSNEPATTARRSFALLGTTVVALHFVNRLSLRWFVESLATTLTILAGLSVFLVVFVPGYGVVHEGYEGAWQGCFFEKNQLGQAMALGIITIATLLEGARGRQRVRMIASLVVFAVLEVGSQSAGAEVSTAVFAVAYPFWLWIRRGRSLKLAVRAAIVAAMLAFAASVFGFGTDQALGLVGRDASLTGRTDVWQACLNAITERPILGYGYREFWDPSGDARYFIAPNEDGWLADMAHSGYLEVALDAGIVGVIVLVGFIAVAATRASKMFWRGNDRLTAWPLFVMIDIIIENFSDRSFVTQDSIFWIVFLAAFWFATDDGLRARERAAIDGAR